MSVSQLGAEPANPPQYTWAEAVVIYLRHLRNVLSDAAQTKVAKGNARVSWTCVSPFKPYVQCDFQH